MQEEGEADWTDGWVEDGPTEDGMASAGVEGTIAAEIDIRHSGEEAAAVEARSGSAEAESEADEAKKLGHVGRTAAVVDKTTRLVAADREGDGVPAEASSTARDGAALHRAGP